MATIHIQDVPEDSYDVLRKRARAAGRSLQSYMRDVVVEFAARPTTEEVLAELEAVRASTDTAGASRESRLADLSSDRR
jgi:plasmid stability protein